MILKYKTMVKPFKFFALLTTFLLMTTASSELSAATQFSNPHVVITDASTAPYVFSNSEHYYLIYLDAKTRAANLNSNQITQMCSNTDIWQSTMTKVTASGANSFGVAGAYLDYKVSGTQTWSAVAFADWSKNDVSAITSKASLHFAVKSTSLEPLDFVLKNGDDEAKIVLGDTPYNDSGTKIQPLGNFPRDGKWYQVDIPMSFLMDEFSIDYTATKTLSSYVFIVLAGATAGTEFGLDAVFLHVPDKSLNPIDYHSMKLWLKDGTSMLVNLADTPVVTFTSSYGLDKVLITTTDKTITLSRTKLLRITYGAESAVGIHAARTSQDIAREGENLLFRGNVSNRDIKVFTIDGKQVPIHPNVSTEGVCLPLSTLPHGIFLVKVKDTTYKIENR